MNDFKIQINDGEIHDYQTKTSFYHLAAKSSLKNFSFDKTKDLKVNNLHMTIIKIWAEHLIPEYGPYYYGYDGNHLYMAHFINNDWIFSLILN